MDFYMVGTVLRLIFEKAGATAGLVIVGLAGAFYYIRVRRQDAIKESEMRKLETQGLVDALRESQSQLVTVSTNHFAHAAEEQKQQALFHEGILRSLGEVVRTQENINERMEFGFKEMNAQHQVIKEEVLRIQPRWEPKS